MKVVLFCGGLGMRLREYSEKIPKPLVPVGRRPIMWNLMRYYATFGHKDFVLCLGYRGDAIKEYFLDYNEALENDFVLSGGGRDITLLARSIDDWRITFANTGLHSNIGERLKAVQRFVEGEEVFFANYTDGLTDLPLDRYLEWFLPQNKIACFVSVRPKHVFHIVDVEADGSVNDLKYLADSGVRINGGFFVFRQAIFDYLHDGEELVLEPFQRLIGDQQLVAYRYDGFWRCMDTFKDQQNLESLSEQGAAPWEVWL